MKRFISIFAITVLLAPLSSCRQDEDEIMNVQTLQNVNKTINDTTKGSKPIPSIDPVDPPIRDGQQWKIKKI